MVKGVQSSTQGWSASRSQEQSSPKRKEGGQRGRRRTVAEIKSSGLINILDIVKGCNYELIRRKYNGNT